ncbi:L,D-transpeptidase [Pseudonocardia phyllosphaerae]|uniref:L,D-transpeptidase n=1 Tax=Pseudonocardia phyllosphaerae TaxID=3390502 RepID=UPI00397D1340
MKVRRGTRSVWESRPSGRHRAAPLPRNHGRVGMLVLGIVLVVAGVGSITAVASGMTPSTRPTAAMQLQPVPAAAPAPRSSAVTRPETSRCPSTGACVDLGHRTAWIQRAGKIVYGPVPISVGRETGQRAPGPDSSATPTGSYEVTRRVADGWSNEFNQPMKWAVHFAPGGIAFHQGALTAGSNGCVHLGPTPAKEFYDRLPVGSDVFLFS